MLHLQNVTYLTTDQDAAKAFFVDALGFEVRQDEQITPQWRRIVVGPRGDGTGFVLALTSGDQQPGSLASTDVMYFLATDDFAADHAHMLGQGVTFLEQPRHEPYGTVAVFEDFQGVRWDLIQPRNAS
ncbi:VOC family protein [Demequina flava]|uniref:VOC family protein n=1 Tax=Demequina flava TaxID=1095025 RepID=UPI000780C12B|nr:VOC family protein [Demequina flava]